MNIAIKERLPFASKKGNGGKVPLKGSSGVFEKMRNAPGRVAAAAAILAGSAMFVAPAVVYAMCKAKEDFLHLSTAMGEYVPAHILDGWVVVTQLPNWQTPAAVTVIGLWALIAAMAIYAWSQEQVSSDLNQLLGPAFSKGNEQGSARLYVDTRLLDGITETWDGSWDEGHEPKQGGIVLGYNKEKKHHYLANPEDHVMLCGTPGSAKTTAVLYPSLEAYACAGSSLIISDPKGELYDATGEDIRRRLYERYGEDRVHIIDFRNTLRSESFNPMDHIYETYDKYIRLSKQHYDVALDILEDGGCDDPTRSDSPDAWGDKDAYSAYMRELRLGHANKVLAWAKAEEAAADTAEAIIPDIPNSPGAHWETSGRKALQSMLLLVGTLTEEDIVGELVGPDGVPVEFTPPLRKQRTLESVKYMFDWYGNIPARGPRPLQVIMDAIDPEHPAVSCFAQLRGSADREYAMIVTEVQKFLAENLNMSTNGFLNKSDFDLGDFGRKQQFLYVCIPDDRPAVGRIFSLLVAQAYSALVAVAVENGKSLPVPVTFCLEEAGSLKITIPQLQSKLAVSRGYLINWVIVCQGDKQFDERYGPKAFGSFMDLCNTKILLQTSDVEGVGKYFSEAMGNYTYQSAKVTKHRKTLGLVDDSNNRSIDTGQRPIMYPDEVAKWDPANGAIVIQKKPSREVTRQARALGYRNMQPCIYPRVQAWETTTGKNLNIGSRQQMSEKAARAERENRLEERIPNVPWEPATSHRRRADIERTLKEGGLSVDAKVNLSKHAQRREVEADVLAAVSDDEVLGLAGEGPLRSEKVEEMISLACERLSERACDLEGPLGEEEAARWLQRREAVTISLMWGLATDAMEDETGADSLKAAIIEKSGARKRAHDRNMAQELANDESVSMAKEEAAKVAQRPAAEEPAKASKDWYDSVRAVADEVISGGAKTMEDFVEGMAERGIAVKVNGKKISFQTEEGVVSGNSLGKKMTLSAINNRLQGKPAKARKSFEESMETVLGKKGYDTARIRAEMELAGTSYQQLYEEDNTLGRFDPKLGRWDCKWERVLDVLQSRFGIVAQAVA